MTKLLEKLHTPKWLFWLLVVVLILRIPSFFEPYSYGDEMIYLTLGEAVRRGIPLYKAIHDNKPPLLYLTAAIAGNLFWFKAILTFWHAISVYLFWKLSEVIFKKTKSQQIVTILFTIFTTIPLLEGNIVNAENFLIGFSIWGFLVLLTKKLNTKNLLFAGFLFSIATLFKIPAAFDIPAIVIYWLIIEKKLNKKSLLKIGKNTLFLFIGFVTPIFLTFVWYTVRGAFQEYLVAAYLQNFGYLSSWRPEDVREPFLTRNGPLLIRALIVLSGFGVIYKFKKNYSDKFAFATTWLLLTLFAVTLSERPYPHYLLQSVAPMAILTTYLFTSKKMQQLYAIIPLTIAFFVPFYYRFWHYKTFPYYQRFAQYLSGKMTINDYLNTFGSQTQRNYKIANLINKTTLKNDKVFVMGDSSVIYALSKRFPPGKYVADYHIKDFSSNSEVLENLEKDNPVYIVVLPGEEVFPDLEKFIERNYAIFDEIDGAVIWKLLNPRVRSLMSS